MPPYLRIRALAAYVLGVDRTCLRLVGQPLDDGAPVGKDHQLRITGLEAHQVLVGENLPDGFETSGQGSEVDAAAGARPHLNGVEWFVMAISVALVLNGLFSRCYLWYVLDISTCKRPQPAPPAGPAG